MSDPAGKKKYSTAWKVFTRNGLDRQARCRLCQQVLSVTGGATSNLNRHIRLKHPDIDLNEEVFPQDSGFIRKKWSPVWRFFAVEGDNNKVRCKLCSKSFSNLTGNTSNLITHLKLNHSKVDLHAKKILNLTTLQKSSKLAEIIKSVTSGSNSACLNDSNDESPSKLLRTEICRDKPQRHPQKIFKMRTPGTKLGRPSFSLVWKFFTKDTANGKAKCRLCKQNLSIVSGATSNLISHVKLRHPDADWNSAEPIESDESSEDTSERDLDDLSDPDYEVTPHKAESVRKTPRKVFKRRKKVSLAWKFFTKDKVNSKAKCRLCEQILSMVGGATSNLINHVKLKHPGADWSAPEPSEPEESVEDSSETNLKDLSDPVTPNRSGLKRKHPRKVLKKRKKVSLAWKFFTKDTVNSKAKCRLCEQILSIVGGATSNLINHVKLKHPGADWSAPEPSEPDESSEDTSERDLDLSDHDSEMEPNKFGSRKTLKKRRKSLVWNFFTKSDFSDKLKCRLCKKLFTNVSGKTSNLSTHLKLKHPNLDLNDEIQPEETVDASEQYNQLNESASAVSNKFSVCLGASNQETTSTPYAEVKREIDTEQYEFSNRLRKRRKQTKASLAWRFFTKTGVDGKAKCRLCEQVFSHVGGATSNLIKHIKTKHPKVDVNVPLPREPTEEEKKRQLDQQIVKFVVKAYQPLSFVEDTEFVTFVRMLNSSYSLPCENVLSTALIPEMHKSIMEKIKKDLESQTSVNITIKECPSAGCDTYVAVSVHFMTENAELQSFWLDCFVCQDDGSDMASQLLTVLSNWGITDKVASVVCGSPDKMDAAVRQCNQRDIPCFANAINSSVQAGLQEINELYRKVLSVVEFFYCSPQASLQLTEFQKQTGTRDVRLKRDIPTKWTSTFNMFQRFLEMKVPIAMTLAVLSQDQNHFLDTDWMNLEKACSLLIVFKNVIEELSNERTVTASKVILISQALVKQIRKLSEEVDLSEEIRRMALVVIHHLENQCANLEQNSLLVESTILDPRFKQYKFHDQSIFKNTCKALEEMITSMQTTSESLPVEESCIQPTSENKCSLWDDFDETVESIVHSRNSKTQDHLEMDRYLHVPIVSRKEDPLVWWRERKHLFPHLFEIMRGRLSIPAFSVPHDQIISKAQPMLSEQQNSLSVAQISDIMFLHYNAALL